MSKPRARCAPYIYVSFPRRRESIGRTLDNRPPNLQARRLGTCPMDSRFRGNDRVAYGVALGQGYNAVCVRALNLSSR